MANRWFMANHLQGGDVIKTTTATLVAGAATVADTTTTANRRVRLYTQTPGGTRGALFLNTITAGTSYAIGSTNAADTSVVFIEVLAL